MLTQIVLLVSKISPFWRPKPSQGKAFRTLAMVEKGLFLLHLLVQIVRRDRKVLPERAICMGLLGRGLVVAGL